MSVTQFRECSLLLKILGENIITRTFYWALMLVVYLYVISSSLLAFRLLAVAIFFGILIECNRITQTSNLDRWILYSISFLSLISVLQISYLQCARDIFLWYSSIVIIYDTMAFLGGKIIRGPKIAVKISPAKTWSGLLVGVISTIISSYYILYFYENPIKQYKMFYFGCILPTILIALSAQAGDLFESYYKRKYNLKDSGVIIPGHGGILDRFDSALFSAPTLCILLLLG